MRADANRCWPDHRRADALVCLLGRLHDAHVLGGRTQRRHHAGLPIEHGWFVDSHIVYAVLLFGLGALGAGRILGVDGIIEKFQVVRDYLTVKYVLG